MDERTLAALDRSSQAGWRRARARLPLAEPAGLGAGVYARMGFEHVLDYASNRLATVQAGRDAG